MIVIYAEKPDMGSKIAATLDKITLSSGKVVTFNQLQANLKAVKAQQAKDGYLKIQFMEQPTIVTWGYGHLCTLKQAADYDPAYKLWTKMPIPFIPEYGIKVVDDKVKQFNLIKKFFNSADKIINATDDDREGDVIFSYVYEAAGCKVPYERSHFADQTYEGIRKGFSSLKSSADAYPSEQAGRARGIADWVVGANITASMTLKTGTLLKYGRVKTPTLNILVQRELERINFKPETYFAVSAVFETDKKEQYKGEHPTKYKDESEAKAIVEKLEGNKGTVADIKSTVETHNPPHLFSLDTLQMEANSKLGFTLAKTLELAQVLYEKGYTTYPRTTTTFLPNDMEPEIAKVMSKLHAVPEYQGYIDKADIKNVIKKNYYDDTKVESHYAIVPTGVIPKGLSADEQKLYDLIVYSVIRMHYPALKMAKTSIKTDVNGVIFNTTGKSIIEKGWTEVAYPMKEQIIPSLVKGQIVDGKYEYVKKTTSPPPRYTDKTLLEAMIAAGRSLENEEFKKILENPKNPKASGIGRPSTRAGLVDSLIKDGYAAREKKTIYPTEKGMEAIKILPIESLKSAIMTAEWETRLRKIEQGDDTLPAFIGDIETILKEWCNDIGTSSFITKGSIAPKGDTGFKCPLCSGKIIRQKWGWGCSAYKTGCKFSIGNRIAGKKLTDAQVKKLLTSGKTNLIKGFTSKKGTKFDAILVIKDGKIEFEFTK